MHRPRKGPSFDPSLMSDLARFIETRCDESISLDRLAREAQLSPAHLQRCFKRAIGVTPKQYQDSCRLRRFKEGLREPKGNVTEALYEAGFGSPSRVYERVESRLGMTPGQYRAGGQGLAISYGCGDSPFGEIVIGATDLGLCFLQFGASKRSLVEALHAEFPSASIREMREDQQTNFELWMNSLRAYFAGSPLDPGLPLDVRGTAFQTKVWQYLQTVPTGSTVTYAAVASAIGQPKAARAVAGACASNRLAIAIPCHRVIRGDGAIAGYRWGVETKKRLLAIERQAAGL